MNVVDDLLDSDADKEIIIVQPGGSISGVTMAVEGTTVYVVGEENVLFLRNDPFTAGVYQTLGMYQGRYRVYYDALKVARVAQHPSGTPVLFKRSATKVETGNDLPLEQFKAMGRR